MIYTNVVKIKNISKENEMNTTKATEIDELKTMIDSACNDILYHPFGEYQECGCRILNATRIFYHNILRIMRNQPALKIGNTEKLTLGQNVEMLKQIKDVLNIVDTVKIKEQKIKEILVKEQLQPEEFLYIDNWENQLLLNVL